MVMDFNCLTPTLNQSTYTCMYERYIIPAILGIAVNIIAELSFTRSCSIILKINLLSNKVLFSTLSSLWPLHLGEDSFCALAVGHTFVAILGVELRF